MPRKRTSSSSAFDSTHSGCCGASDFWHVAEYLNAAAVVLETRGKALPGQFRRWRRRLKEEPGGAARIVRELETSRCSQHQLRNPRERPVEKRGRSVEYC